MTSRDTRFREQIGQIVRKSGWLRAEAVRLRGELIEILWVKLITYLNSAFAALDTPTTGHRSLLSHYVSKAVPSITKAFRVLVEVAEGLRGSAAVNN